jgi:hypothetical protein
MGKKESPEGEEEVQKIDSGAALRFGTEMAKVRAMASSMQPAEIESLDADAITFGESPDSQAGFQAVFNLDQLPQLQTVYENGFRDLIRSLANSLKARPEGIMVRPEVLVVLEKVCELKGVRLNAVLSLTVNKAVLQEENSFRILSDEAAMAYFARKIPRN